MNCIKIMNANLEKFPKVFSENEIQNGGATWIYDFLT